MADKHSYRPIPLARIALVALFSALALLAISGHDAQATAVITPGRHFRQGARIPAGRAQALDHVTWTASRSSA